MLVLQKNHTNPTGPQILYLEGDGDAFTPHGQPSLDPTPRHPVGWQLAQADPRPASLYYIGRPCQWGGAGRAPAPACTRDLWTKERFTAAQVAAYVSLISALTQGQPTELVGYSGGAFLARAVAAQLPNVIAVRSVAGNLEPNAVNRHHRVPLMDVAAVPPLPTGIPFLAYWAERDRVIPAELGRSMAHRSASCLQQKVVPGTTHITGWAERWPELSVSPRPACRS